MQPARLPSASLAPGLVSDDELFWHWRQSLSPFFDCRPAGDVREAPRPLRSTQYHLGDFLFVHASFPGQSFVRDADWRRRHDDADHVLLQVFLAGSNGGSNGDTDFLQEPGNAYAVNLGHEVDAVSGGADTLSLVLPRPWLAEHLPVLRDARGALFAKDGMAARLFADYMVSLHRNLPLATLADAPTISANLVGFLGSLLAQREPVDADARAGTMQALQRHIDANLADPALGPEALCARFRMSRATLFRLFRDQGGVRSYIQQRRLAACRRALSSPRNAGRPIYDIALDCGLANPSHLSTLFREQFGMSPSELREAARQRWRQPGWDPEAEELPAVETMRRWALGLGRSERAAADRDGPER